jgi:hypothetical protein
MSGRPGQVGRGAIQSVRERRAAPGEDADMLAFCRALGVPGLADGHVHFLPPRLLRRVWEYFDAAGPLVGTTWPIRYRWPDEQRVAHLGALGVRAFSALAYAHRPGMAADLNAWTLEFARATPGCLPSATFYPERGVTDYVRRHSTPEPAFSRCICRWAASRRTSPGCGRCGGCWPRRLCRWWCTPGTRQWPRPTPALDRSRRCWAATRG